MARQRDELRAQLERALALREETVAGYEGSVSWRLTKPLRSLAHRRREGG